MTGPQLEHGHVRIANELFDAIVRTDFSKRQLRVLLFIIRKTYGFGKKTDDMTVQQIANGTGLARQNVSTTISELVALNTVSKRDGHFGYVLGINKNYGEWRTVSKQDTSQNETPPVSKQCGPRLKTRHTKDNPQKTTPIEGGSARATPSSEPDPIPPGIPPDSWQAFEEHRQRLGRPLTNLARRTIWKNLLQIDEARRSPALDSAIARDLREPCYDAKPVTGSGGNDEPSTKLRRAKKAIYGNSTSNGTRIDSHVGKKPGPRSIR